VDRSSSPPTSRSRAISTGAKPPPGAAAATPTKSCGSLGRFRSWAWLLAALAACGGEYERLELVGTVERTALELAAPVSEVIVEIPAEQGSRVEAGAVVARLDSTVAEAELLASQAALAAAEAAVVEARREFERAERLRRSNVGSTQQADRARRLLDEALALTAERNARIAQATKRLDDLTITTRSAGVIDQLPFEEGERVPAGGVVAVVQTDEKAWVRVWIPARAAARAGSDTRAAIRVEGLEKTLNGHVEDVAREPEFTPHYALTERESAHLVYRARVAVDDAPADLRPGLPARIELFVPRRPGAGE
jgi:HlyD family secretion protein